MKPIPRDGSFGQGLNLLREGYLFISRRCRRYETDIFQTRLLGIKVICLSGAEAVKVFYNNEYFQRKGAIPKRLQKTMIGEHAVQTLDGAAHRHRKQLLLSLVSAPYLSRLRDIAAEEWSAAIAEWEQKESVVLFTEARKILYRTACRWTGVPLEQETAAEMAEALGDLVGALGAVMGPRYREGKRSRQNIDRKLTALIEQVRAGELQPGEETALMRIAMHRDLEGDLLDSSIAAVELNALLHTVVSVAIYIAFGALALHTYPHCRGRLAEAAYVEWFIQEVRRFYPFGPFIGARVRKDFTWRGYELTKGTRVLLDIYGTNRDPRVWEQPDTFQPERFQDWPGSDYTFIPHGGGDAGMGHRCAGEGATMELLKVSFTMLTQHMAYTVPEQNLGYSLVRMPTVPRDGIVLDNVRQLFHRDGK